jgi:hypothetical protein
MQEIVNCPSCQRKLQVPDSLLGQDVQCPTCGATFTAGSGGGAPAGPVSSPAPAPTSDRPDAGYDVGPEPAERRERRRRPRDDYDDYDDDRDRPRRRRRDLAPHRGSLILTLGILSLVLCNILGPFAWVMGNQDLAEIRAGRMDPEGEGMTQGGRICGMIASIFLIIGFALLCLWIVVVAGAIGAGGARGGRGF